METQDRLEESLEEDSGLLVASLVASDEGVVPTLRSVLERGWEDRFNSSLDHYLMNKETELRNLCNFHFAEFSEGVEEISALKIQSENLRTRLRGLDDSLQNKGAEVLKSAEYLLRIHRFDRNLKQAQVELRRVINLVHLVQQTRKQVENKSFFEALQSIDIVREVVQGEDIRRLWQERRHKSIKESSDSKTSRFNKGLERWIPEIVERVKVDVNDGLTDWFVRARNRAADIGSRALEMVSERRLQALAGFTKFSAKQQAENSRAASNGTEKKVTKKASLSRMRSRSSSDAALAWEHREPTHTVDIAEACLHEILSLTPVLQYIDIQNYLGEREKAIDFYRRNRVPHQFLLTMCSIDPQKMEAGNCAKQLQMSLEKITGYFIIEGSLTRSANLLSPYELASLWNSILDSLTPLIRAQIHSGLHTESRATLNLVQLLINLTQLLGRNDGSSNGSSEAAMAAVAAVTTSSTSFFSFRKSTSQSETSNGGPDDRDGTGDPLLSLGIQSNKMLDTSRLLDICISERQSIADVLVSFGCGELTRILNEEKCSPLKLGDMEDPLTSICIRFGFDSLDFDDAPEKSRTSTEIKETFKSLKCSDTVPKACQAVIELMDTAFSLARQLGGTLPVQDINLLPKDRRSAKSQVAAPLTAGFSSSFVSSAACAAQVANICLERMNSSLLQVVQSDGTPAENLCQSSVNLWFLSKACQTLELYIKSLGNISEEEMEELDAKGKETQGSKSSSSPAAPTWWTLPVAASFLNASDLAQSRVMDSIQEKIEALMSGCDLVNWTPEELVDAPHEFVVDTVRYLSFSFSKESRLRLLPWSKVQATHYASSAKILQVFLEILCGDRVAHVNALSMFRLSLDIDVLLKFASESDVPDLAEYFTRLSQLATLIVTDDLGSYLNESNRARKYGQLPPDMVVSVLRKYKQLSGSSRLFTSASTKFKLIKDVDIKRALQTLDN